MYQVFWYTKPFTFNLTNFLWKCQLFY